ncbi:DAK2 domain-containing protein [Nocardioides sp. ChNu-153]|uniref:DAK2 domain-containing protein n=1 Tax=unclassified Nocardioides TaxID=2615069 RepID=UPI00240771D0|nr:MULTISPECIES: DAK2 domain-containing protein [unclassified Nocardioides]MDF9716941.1 DAK2 domain-containing protein [Nocardioides sp. ChNu-99]MDN7122646.1 DAK2 domain-containing protein [Nocardioides sp. ChNu-153]
MSGAGQPVRLEVVARFVHIATDALADAREEIDALNVFPVPDGDTGTNMFLTMSAAREAMVQALDAVGLAGIAGDAHAGRPVAAEVGPEQLATVLRALARGALLGARGNSGVILAQMLGAVAAHLGAAADGRRTAVLVAGGLTEATRASYAAVGEPVEGTMLTVARAASEAAEQAARAERPRSRDVYVAAAAAAREALARTPELLPALAAAGVVDAGGRGLCVILDAAETALTGRRPLPVPVRLGHHTIPVASPVASSVASSGHPPAPATDGASSGAAHAPAHLPGYTPPYTPAYEVMYLLDRSDDAAVTRLREQLSAIGDSLVVIGAEGLWNVHVHVDDAGAAIEAGVAAGRPHQIRVTHFRDHARHDGAGHGHGHGHRPERASDGVAEAGATGEAGTSAAAPHRRTGRAVVAVSAGPGLAAVFEEAGAVAVPGGPGERPSAGMLLDAVRRTGAAEVVILPNDPDSVRTAEVAARTAEEDGDVVVAVVPSRAQVQGLAALAVHEPGRAFGPDVLEMTSAARHCRHGAVTEASRRAMTTAGPCEAGDVLGVVMGDFAVVGHDRLTVAVEVVTRLLAVGGELVTVVAGAGSGDLAARLAAHVEEEHPGVDVVTYEGGQPRYALLVSVE